MTLMITAQWAGALNWWEFRVRLTKNFLPRWKKSHKVMLEEDFKCVPQGILNILSAALGEEVIFCQIYIYSNCVEIC